MTKRTALLCSLFITVQWILSCALMNYRASWMYGAYIGICGLFAVTLPFFVIFDGPLRHNIIYQIVLACTVWSTGVIITVEMVSAGPYDPCLRLVPACASPPRGNYEIGGRGGAMAAAEHGDSPIVSVSRRLAVSPVLSGENSERVIIW